MTAASGVPPWARPVLEALENLACGYIGPDWRAVKDACTAALASDAGTPEGEPCPQCRASPCTTEADHCGPRPVPAQEPAPAPAPGDASGETRLGDLLDHMLAEHGAAISPTTMSRDEHCAHVDLRDSYKADILRLYRAATGEVVATGTVTGRSWEGGPVPRFAQLSLTVGDTSRLPLGTPVSLVVRRDKEGVCE